jgi:hypothetical protein
MGHAYPEKISKHINKLLGAAWMAQKHVTITEIMDSLVANKIKLSASEGYYDPSKEDQRPTVCQAVEEIMSMLQSEGLVDPRPVTKDQKRILKQMERGEDADWDCGDDGKSGEYGIYDSIPWWPMKRRFWIIRRLEH